MAKLCSQALLYCGEEESVVARHRHSRNPTWLYVSTTINMNPRAAISRIQDRSQMTHRTHAGIGTMLVLARRGSWQMVIQASTILSRTQAAFSRHQTGARIASHHCWTFGSYRRVVSQTSGQVVVVSHHDPQRVKVRRDQRGGRNTDEAAVRSTVRGSWRLLRRLHVLCSGQHGEAPS